VNKISSWKRQLRASLPWLLPIRGICLSASNVMSEGVGELRRFELHIIKVGAVRFVCKVILNSQPLAT